MTTPKKIKLLTLGLICTITMLFTLLLSSFLITFVESLALSSLPPFANKPLSSLLNILIIYSLVKLVFGLTVGIIIFTRAVKVVTPIKVKPSDLDFSDLTTRKLVGKAYQMLLIGTSAWGCAFSGFIRLLPLIGWHYLNK